MEKLRRYCAFVLGWLTGSLKRYTGKTIYYIDRHLQSVYYHINEDGSPPREDEASQQQRIIQN